MFPTREQINTLPPELQQIILAIGVQSPAVWQYLFILAVQRLGVLTLSLEDLRKCDGQGAIGIAVLDDGIEIGFCQTKSPEQAIASVRKERAKTGQSPNSTLVVDTGCDFTKKKPQ